MSGRAWSAACGEAACGARWQAGCAAAVAEASDAVGCDAVGCRCQLEGSWASQTIRHRIGPTGRPMERK